MTGVPLTKKEINELLVKEKICWLATVSPKRQPHVIPMNFGFFQDQVHIIFVSNKSKSVRNIESNPRVCFGINAGWRKGEIECVLIHGRAKLIDDIDALKQAHMKILPKYLPSIKEAKDFLQKLIVSGEIVKRVLVVVKPEKTGSWKI